MPSFVEQLPALQAIQLPDQPNEVFPYIFLKQILGGTSVSHNCFTSTKSGDNRPFPEVTLYKALNPDYDPLLPRRPGQHGAQISCILSDEELDGVVFPLFIRYSEGGYRYFGHYREPRYDDLIGGSEVCQIPKHVKQYWAKKLGDRPKSQKVVDTLIFGWGKTTMGTWVWEAGKLLPYDTTNNHNHDFLIQRYIEFENAVKIDERRVLKALERVRSRLPMKPISIAD